MKAKQVQCLSFLVNSYTSPLYLPVVAIKIDQVKSRNYLYSLRHQTGIRHQAVSELLILGAQSLRLVKELAIFAILCCYIHCGESSQPVSGSGSQGPEAPSVQCSVATSRSAEERLRQIRATEEIRQRQRYAAMIEAQRQADITRQKLQEDRRRKIDALRQREEARRNLVMERRKEMEMSNKARMDQLLEKSASRIHRDGNALTTSTYRAPHLRTASAAPLIGSNRHPNHLMTSSCVVAFGCSAPRSMLPAFRSVSSQDFPRVDRKQRAPTTASGAKQLSNSEASDADKLSTVSNSARSASVDFLSDKKTTTIPDVFQRLSAPKTRRTNAASGSSIDRLDVDKLSDGEGSVPDKPPGFRKPTAAPLVQTKRRADMAPAASSKNGVTGKPKPLTSQHNAPRGMSASMHVERTSRKPTAAAGDALSQEQRTPTSSLSASSEFWANDAVSAGTAEPAGSVISVSSPGEQPPDEQEDEREPTELSAGDSTLSEVAGPDVGVSSCLLVSTGNEVESIGVSSSVSPFPSFLAVEDDPNANTGEKSPPVSRDSLSPSPSPSVTKTREVPTVNGSSPVPTPSTAGVWTVGTTATSLLHTGPLKAETRGSGDAGHLSDNEAAIYRAKLVEQRRLAKERKEQEQRRLDEENRLRREQLEEARIAAEKELQGKLEVAAREAQQVAAEAEEQQRIREEEEKVKLQVLESERIAKLQRAEEERVLRKKRLDSIMSRLKPGGSAAGDGRPSNSNSSSTTSITALAAPAEDASALGGLPPAESEQANNTATGGSDHDLAQVPSSQSLPDSNGLGGNSELSELANGCPQTVHEDGQLSDGAHDSETHDYQPSRPKFGLSAFPSPPEDQSSSTVDDLVTQPKVLATPIPAPQEEEYRTSECDDKSADQEGYTTTTSLVTVDGLGDRGDLTGLPATDTTNNSHPAAANSTGPSVQPHDHPTADELSGSSVNTSPQRQAPKFKSALLQSMLGGGRLATRAKDAVADLRRKSSTASLDTLGEGNPANAMAVSTSPWDGFSGLPGNGTLDSPLIGNYQTGGGDSPMVRSMFDRSLDRLQANGSNPVH